MTDQVAIGFDVAGYVRAFTTGTLNACKAAARTYKRKKNGMRVYPVVKVMTWEEWEAMKKNQQWIRTTYNKKYNIDKIAACNLAAMTGRKQLHFWLLCGTIRTQNNSSGKQARDKNKPITTNTIFWRF